MRSGAWPLVVAALGVAPPAAGQRSVGVQLGGLAAFADTRFVGVGAGVTIRLTRRVGMAVGVTAGDVSGAVAGRGEAVVHYHLSPERRRGWGAYGLAGIAAQRQTGDGQELLVAAVGFESRPYGARGWFLELGLGGGVRLAIGFRWRRLGGPPAVRGPN